MSYNVKVTMRKLFKAIPLLISVAANANIGLAVADEGTDQSMIEHVHLPDDMLDGIEDGKMYYQRVGDPQGQRVIFLHGTPGSKDAWKDYMVEVPEGLEYISVDRPAFGDSDPKKVVPIMRQVQLMETLLTTSPDGRKPIVVGHSYGGTMAAIMAALYQDKLGAIVILAGSVSPALDNPMKIQRLGQYPPFVYMIPGGLRKANDEVIALEEEAKQFPALWPNIRIPVVVLQGEKDPLVSVKNIDYMRETMINAELDIKILEGVNHFIPWNSKEHVEERIRTAIEYSQQ